MVWPAIIAAGAAIGSSLMGQRGARETNEANAEIAREQMAWNSFEADKSRLFNAEQAAKQMDFQEAHIHSQRAWSENMANSAYQRAVGDLQKAGLNPMLAYSQGGAPTPATSAPGGAAGSGTAASYHSLPNRQNVAQAGLASAAQALQLQNMAKQGENIDADTALKREQAGMTGASANKIKYETERIITGEIPKLRKEIDWITKQEVNSEDRRLLDQAHTELAKMQKHVEEGRIGYVEAQSALAKIETELKKLQIPEAKAYAEKFKGDFGKDVTPYLREVLDILRVLIYGRGSWRP